ncbi:hypothetical protein [Acinetobacter sp. YH12126]|uniref:hypothetical protein n=1 Tax=Acinetobacter sp. YH12126 TaxID=2601111 RepID=UPI0015D36856|nr:hypothetical protein [Acinetobacter sp. YH12126]
MKLTDNEIREHLKEFYRFKDEYNKKYKDEQRLIDYVYRLSHPSVKPYVHILRRQTDHHILVLDLIYKDAVETAIGVNNTFIGKNSNYNDYSIPRAYAPTKPLKGKPPPPGIGCDFQTTRQLEMFMLDVFGLKIIK